MRAFKTQTHAGVSVGRDRLFLKLIGERTKLCLAVDGGLL